MRIARLVVAVAVVLATATSGLALAADAPKSTTTSKTLFLSQEGCGTTAGPGLLLPTAQDDSATGCGTIGGVPLGELEARDSADFCPCGDDYTTNKKFLGFKMDRKPITGQLASGSWVGAFGGVGTVSFDITLSGVTTAGKTIALGATTASGSVSPTNAICDVPFTLPATPAAANQKFKAFTLHVFMHGLNVPMSAKQLSGESYMVFPAKK